jgi:hypothetical protein
MRPTQPSPLRAAPARWWITLSITGYSLAACLLAACLPAATQADTRRERAEEHRGPRCADASPADRAARLLDRATLLAVEPATATVQAGHGNREARLRGARLRYVAPPTATPAFLEHTIDCHQADVALGLVAPAPDDPFVLPDSWLTVEVRADHGDLVIELRGHDHATATEVLHRARRFAGLPPAE